MPLKEYHRVDDKSLENNHWLSFRLSGCQSWPTLRQHQPSSARWHVGTLSWCESRSGHM